MLRSNLRRKRLPWLIGCSLSLKEAKAGTQGRKLEGRTKAYTTEACYLLACFLWLTDSYFSWTAQANLPGHGTVHSGLGPLWTLTNDHWRHAHRPVWWSQFFKWGSWFLGVSSWQSRSAFTVHRSSFVYHMALTASEKVLLVVQGPDGGLCLLWTWAHCLSGPLDSVSPFASVFFVFLSYERMTALLGFPWRVS